MGRAPWRLRIVNVCVWSGLGKINTRLAPGCCAALARTGSGHMYPVTALLLLS